MITGESIFPNLKNCFSSTYLLTNSTIIQNLPTGHFYTAPTRAHGKVGLIPSFLLEIIPPVCFHPQFFVGWLSVVVTVETAAYSSNDNNIIQKVSLCGSHSIVKTTWLSIFIVKVLSLSLKLFLPLSHTQFVGCGMHNYDADDEMKHADFHCTRYKLVSSFHSSEFGVYKKVGVHIIHYSTNWIREHIWFYMDRIPSGIFSTVLVFMHLY